VQLARRVGPSCTDAGRGSRLSRQASHQLWRDAEQSSLVRNREHGRSLGRHAFRLAFPGVLHRRGANSLMQIKEGGRLGGAGGGRSCGEGRARSAARAPLLRPAAGRSGAPASRSSSWAAQARLAAADGLVAS
jgi:hypothetical protein